LVVSLNVRYLKSNLSLATAYRLQCERLLFFLLQTIRLTIVELASDYSVRFV